MFSRRVATHPQFEGLVRIDVQPLPDDPDKATAVTIGRMAQFAAEDSTSDLVTRATMEALPGSLESFYDLCSAIHSWIRSHVRFVRDSVPSAGAGLPEDTEVVIRPVDLLRMIRPAGDCDCMQTLAGAMLMSARRMTGAAVHPFFVAIAADGRRPREYSHVYTTAELNGVVIPVDVSHGPVAGWEAPNRFGKKRAWSVDGVSMLAKIAGGRGPFLNGLGADVGMRPRAKWGRLRGIGALGDDSIDLSTTYFDQITGGSSSPSVMTGPSWNASNASYNPALPTVPSASAASSSIWSSILPGVFKTGEQIALQTTRPAGLYTVTSPTGQTLTYSMPTSGAAAGLAPGLPLSIGGSGGSILLWGGIAVALVLAVKAFSR